MSPLQAEEFVIIYPVLHPFFSDTSRGAREQAEKMDGINLIITGPYNQSSEEQIEILEQYIEQGVDAIAIGAVDEDKLVPTINDAIMHGIPVLCFDTDCPDSERLTFIVTDNYQAGIEMAKQVILFLGGNGNVVISVTSLNMRNMMERVEGFKQYISNQSHH